MTEARTNILARLRSDKCATATPADSMPDFGLPEYTDPVQVLKLQMESVQTEVHRVKEQQFVDQLRELTLNKAIGSLLYSPAAYPGELIARQDSTALPLVACESIASDWKAEIFTRIDAAITGTCCAIAQTGSLVIWPTADEPRMMSLVPPVHIAVLDATKIYPDFQTAMDKENWLQRGMPTNALLVSGPSKTADIEQTLAYGVHGPKELILFIVER